MNERIVRILLSLIVCLALVGCLEVPKNEEIAEKLSTHFHLPLKHFHIWGIEEKDPYLMTFKVGVGKMDYLMKFRLQDEQWRLEQVKVGDTWLPYYQATEPVVYNIMKDGMYAITVALKNFFETNNRYPSSLSELQDINIMDPWDNDYVYVPKDEYYRYDLSCNGADGVPGGPDDLSVNQHSEWSR